MLEIVLLRSPHQVSPPCFERPKAVDQFPENVAEGHYVHAAQGRNVAEGHYEAAQTMVPPVASVLC